MKYISFLPFLLISSLLFTCETAPTPDQKLETILLDPVFLAHSKSKIEKIDPAVKDAYEQLIKEAEKALSEGPFSVTEKEKLPPSGDIHDYASYSRYWWPDTTKVDGLPYIRRDGLTNPASQSLKESDRRRIGDMGKNTETLALAYYFTGEEKYATKAAELLRVWFLDKATFMNPNVNHAQCRQGHNTGSKSGVLDGRLMVRALEGSKLIASSSALSANEYRGLKEWAADYFEWLTTNDMALQEAAAGNNHGTFYDVQAMYFALYSDNYEEAKTIAQQFMEKRVLAQIKSDGSMPEELARTRPLFYSMYNLHAMFLVANLAKKIDVDIYQAKNKEARLRTGLDYLLPYVDPEIEWPEPFIVEVDKMEFFPILQMAEKGFPGEDYLKAAEKLPLEKRKVDRSVLVFPLMR